MVTTRKRRSQTFVPIGNAKPDKRITAIPEASRWASSELKARSGPDHGFSDCVDQERGLQSVKTSAWGYWKTTCPSSLPPIWLSCPLSLSSSGGRGHG